MANRIFTDFNKFCAVYQKLFDEVEVVCENHYSPNPIPNNVKESCYGLLFNRAQTYMYLSFPNRHKEFFDYVMPYSSKRTEYYNTYVWNTKKIDWFKANIKHRTKELSMETLEAEKPKHRLFSTEQPVQPITPEEESKDTITIADKIKTLFKDISDETGLNITTIRYDNGEYKVECDIKND